MSTLKRQEIALLLKCLAFLLSCSLFINCQNKENRDTTFEWYSAWGAPTYYPVELLNGAFILPEEGEISLFQAPAIGRGWGVGAAEYGGKKFPVPEGLYVYWYSFTEDKFYEGAFKLPQDTMLKLFREGFNRFRAKMHITYDEIAVGLAPGGVVAVWLTGYGPKGCGKEVEIGYFKAHEGKRLTNEHFESYRYWSKGDSAWTVYRKEMLEGMDAADHLKRYRIPFGVWDAYREKFNFRPVLLFDDDSTCVTDEIYMDFFNGEKESLSLDELEENPFKMRARIRYIEVYWSFGQNIRYMTLEFDEKEIFEAYKKICEGNSNTPIELQIHSSESKNYLNLFLTCVEKGNFRRIQLKHTKINVYIEDEYSRHYYEVFKNR